jgi:3-deoxy-D-manno-octulosonic acid kinase
VGIDRGVTVPAPYRLLRAGAVRAAVREDLVPHLAAWILAPHLAIPPDAEVLPAGRGPAYRLTLGDGTRAVLRLSRRGGLLARVVRSTYAGVRPRPLRELVVISEARRRGVPAPEVLAARVEGRLLYRGALVTAEVPAAVTLLDALRRAPDAATRRALAASAGRAIARMHAAGVFHADLNLRNILVQQGSDEAAVVTLVDFDRARLRGSSLSAVSRRRNLRRLSRSLAKLDPAGVLAGPDERDAFRAAYGVEGSCAS